METLQRILSYKELHQELLDLTTLQVPVQYKYLGPEKGMDEDDDDDDGDDDEEEEEEKEDHYHHYNTLTSYCIIM